MKDGAQLYRVAAKVRPAPGHTRYWEVSHGYLLLWLFADSEFDACKRAQNIINELPYEIVGTKFKVGLSEEEGDDDQKFAQSTARSIGLGMMLGCLRIGSDDANFEDSEFP